MDRRAKFGWIVILIVIGLATSCAQQPTSVIRRAARSQPKANRECAKVPACLAYLESMKRQVYAVWKPSGRLPEGSVVIGMEIDANGTPIRMDTVYADSPELARSCRTAIGYAEPFGLLPPGMNFLRGEYITIEFVYSKPRSTRSPPASAP